MSEFREFFQGAISAFVSIGVSDILDILIVAFIIFKLLSMVHTGSTARVAKAIVFLVLLTLVTSVAKMHMLNFILSNILSLGFIALVILFQPELRRMLDHMSNIKLKSFLGIRKPVIKAHGSSDALAFRNAVKQAMDAAGSDISEELEEGLKALAIKENEND